MAKRRNIKRDRRGRFAPTGSRSSRVKRAVPTKVDSRKVSGGRVGWRGEYVGVRAGIELKPKRGRTRYYVASAPDAASRTERSGGSYRLPLGAELVVAES